MAAPKGPFYREFGKKLAGLRREKKITQEALAKAVGLSRTSIVNIEKGRQPVHFHLAAHIASSLSHSVIALLPDLLPVAESKVTSELDNLSPPTRAWAEKVISSAAYEEESGNATKVFAGKAQGQRADSRRKGKTSARPS